MYQAFDPYHKWLGILPKDQPPHHYRLLGLVVFESDPDAIDNAANSRMAQLRMYQTGEHAVQSEALLNEIAAARLCLLDPARKVMYDRQLRQQLAAQEAAQPLPPARQGGVPGVPAAHTASAGQMPYAAPFGGANVAPQGVPTAMPAVPSAIPVRSPDTVPQGTPVATPAVPVAAPIEQRPSRREAPSVYSMRRRQTGLNQSVTIALVLVVLLLTGVAAVFLLGGFESYVGGEKEKKPVPVYYERP